MAARSVRWSVLQRLRRVMRNDDGVSAIEFALFAPMLVFALLAMVDVGLAVAERMTIGHILRAGAQGATEHIGEAAVDRMLRSTARDMMPVTASGIAGNDTTLSLDVDMFYSCPATPAVAVAPATTCAGNQPTQVFYALSASKTYTGLILPSFPLSRSLLVQVR